MAGRRRGDSGALINGLMAQRKLRGRYLFNEFQFAKLQAFAGLDFFVVPDRLVKFRSGEGVKNIRQHYLL